MTWIISMQKEFQKPLYLLIIVHSKELSFFVCTNHQFTCIDGMFCVWCFPNLINYLIYLKVTWMQQQLNVNVIC